MPIELAGNSIETTHIFFGLLSFIIYKSLSIEDRQKYRHLDILMIILLGIFTAKFISILNFNVAYTYILVIYLFLSLGIGFIFALLERVFHHVIFPFCRDIFSKLKLDSINQDRESRALDLLLYQISRATKRNNELIDKIKFEVTIKGGEEIKGYLSGHSPNDLCLSSSKGNKFITSNISLTDISKIRIIIDKKDVPLMRSYRL